ncbi:MAG: hypothetical protein ABIS36_01940 [Chryseolinea sp.]
MGSYLCDLYGIPGYGKKVTGIVRRIQLFDTNTIEAILKKQRSFEQNTEVYDPLAFGMG